MVEESWTPKQKATREEIFERFKCYLFEATSDEDFYAKCWADFPVWCVAFLDDDSGKPLFLANWQILFNDEVQAHDYVWANCTRKCGKSTATAAVIAHALCGPDKIRIVIFAPTHGQEFVAKKVRAYLKGNAYLANVFLENDTTETITMVNGSILNSRSIAISSGGTTNRGEFGDWVVVDEIQSIEQYIMDTIIYPIISDAYSRKKMILIGTPDVRINPQLQTNWDAWQESSAKTLEYGFFTIDCWRAIEEGCMKPEYVLDRKSKMTREDFCMEYEAKFPDTSLRFYPMSLLDSLPGKLSFKPAPKRECQYIMTVDWAKYVNNTQIVVGEWDPIEGTLSYADWVEINPTEARMNYEDQAEKVKELFWHWNVEWINPDATSNQDALVSMLRMKIKDQPGIPDSAFYGYDRDKEPEMQKLGYRASDVSNWEMWRNHKEQMLKKDASGKGPRIRVPSEGEREQRFVERYKEEHHGLQASGARSNTIYKLEEQPGTNKDLAVAAAMMSIWLENVDRVPASNMVMCF